MKKQRQQRDMDRILRIPGIKKTCDMFTAALERHMMPPEDYVGNPITDKIGRFMDDFVKQLQDELDYVTKGKYTPTVTRIKDLICIMYHDHYGRNTPCFLRFEKSKYSDDFCCIRCSWRWHFTLYLKGMYYTEGTMEIDLANYDKDKYLAQNIRNVVICHLSELSAFGTQKINYKLAKSHGWIW